MIAIVIKSYLELKPNDIKISDFLDLRMECVISVIIILKLLYSKIGKKSEKFC